MYALISLIRREFAAYFLSPIAYVTLAVFLLVTGHLFYLTMVGLTEEGPQGIEYPMQKMLGDPELLAGFPVHPPASHDAITRRRTWHGHTGIPAHGADPRLGKLWAGKYIGALLFYIVLALPTLIYVPVLVNLDWATFTPRIDPTPVLTAYLGFFAAGAMFLAIGLFFSSMVKSQLVAALIAMVFSLVFIVSAFWMPELDANSFAQSSCSLSVCLNTSGATLPVASLIPATWCFTAVSQHFVSSSR